MAKRKGKDAHLKRAAKQQLPPALRWVEHEDGFQPFVCIANILMPLERRPFHGFYEGERDAILHGIKLALSEVLFDVPRYLVHPVTGASAPNPDWDLLPFFRKNLDGSYDELEGKPTELQLAASADADRKLHDKGL